MKSFWTWRKIALFLGIIGLGIVGIMVADQQDFLDGRTTDPISIGDGNADPLVVDDTVSIPTQKEIPKKKTIQKTVVPIKKQSTPKTQAEVSVIDGIKKP